MSMKIILEKEEHAVMLGDITEDGECFKTESGNYYMLCNSSYYIGEDNEDADEFQEDIFAFSMSYPNDYYLCVRLPYGDTVFLAGDTKVYPVNGNFVITNRD